MAAGYKINRDSYPGRLVSLSWLLPLFSSLQIYRKSIKVNYNYFWILWLFFFFFFNQQKWLVLLSTLGGMFKGSRDNWMIMQKYLRSQTKWGEVSDYRKYNTDYFHIIDIWDTLMPGPNIKLVKKKCFSFQLSLFSLHFLFTTKDWEIDPFFLNV